MAGQAGSWGVGRDMAGGRDTLPGHSHSDLTFSTQAKPPSITVSYKMLVNKSTAEYQAPDAITSQELHL